MLTRVAPRSASLTSRAPALAPLAARSKRTSYTVRRGPGFAPHRRRLAAELTKELLDSGAWETTAFKEYNFESAGKEPGGGHVHALMKVQRDATPDALPVAHPLCPPPSQVRAEFRQILLEMGFSEMPTARWVPMRPLQ